MKFLTYIINTPVKRKSYFFVLLLSCFFISGIVPLSFSQESEARLKVGHYNPRLSGMYSSLNPSAVSERETTSDFFPDKFPLDKKHCTEDLSKRTLKSRTYISDDGQVVVESALESINYYDRNKQLQPLYPKLSSCVNGWEAQRQEFPAFLNRNGSTEISLYEKTFEFNSNCKINNQEINLADYTVGKDGMYARNVVPFIDKKILFNENMIETDYIIHQPVSTSQQNLVFSEEINLPEGYSIRRNPKPVPFAMEGVPRISEEDMDEYVVMDAAGRVQAQLKTPVYYDKKMAFMAGKYNLMFENNKTILQLIVPNAWLNDASRAFPVTIDPVVFGPYSWYPPVIGPFTYPIGWLPSCQFPNWSSDSMLVTVPANITVTNFIVWDSYYADLVNPIQPIQMIWGKMYLNDVCGTTPVYVAGGVGADSAGYAYLDSADLKSYLGCCFMPSCNTQSFYLSHHFSRMAFLGPGCNLSYVYYSPNSPWRFHCFFIGHTVETTQAQWFVFPSPVCSDSCTIKLRAITNYGVPPYTLTHPWAAGSITYGQSSSGCNSSGTDTILLTIPGCPTYCGATQTLAVPPPSIVDVCGNTVAGLTPKNITINPAPDVQATNVNVCAGTPVTIPLTSCVATATFAWTGSNLNNGTGNITDNIANGGVVTYTVTPTANGCAGGTATVTATAAPQPTASIANTGTFICGGQPVTLTGSGGPPYQWSGGSTSTNSTITVSPAATTTYTLTVGSGLCTDWDSVTIAVAAFPVPTVAGNQTICVGESTTLTATGANTYVWSGGTNSTNASIVVSPAVTTTFYVTGSTACGTANDTAIVFVNPLPVITTPNNDTTVTGGTSVQLYAAGGSSYVWSGSNSSEISCTACPNPVVTPLTTTTYTLTGTDTNGCVSTDYFTITVLPGEDELYIPNTITPNGNDRNEVFYVYGINIHDIHMQVFNRWGELIFESIDKSKGWDGTINRIPVPLGVYVYVVYCTFNDKKSVKRIGNINVIE